MSSSKFPLIGFAVVLILLVGGIFVMSSRNSHKLTLNNTTTTSQVVTPTPTPVLPGGNSDTQLNQDSTQIDNSLNSLDTDVNAIDQGLNDQQTNLQ